MKKFLRILGICFLALGLAIFAFLFVGFPDSHKNDIVWGVNFSQKQAQNLGVDWKENYLALLDDLNVRNLRIASYWDLIEKKQGKYDFSDLDWQIKTAEERGAKVILVVGRKTPRWPECHEPEWALNYESAIMNQELLKYIEKIVDRYKDSSAIWAWQVENEPFFPFGECPKPDKELLKKEIELVRLIDVRPVMISESGEVPFWFKAGRYGDIIGITMYQKVWFKELNNYISYPFPPIFYSRKADIIKWIFRKKVLCVEFQAEPWGPKLLYDNLALSEQEKTMSLEQFKKNVEFAEKTGLDSFYLWGSEWAYWMREKQAKPKIWEEMRKLF
ncbi:MAG: hypothetical protein A2W55_01000 [Candidatus Nealsonbacteria bacterium RIFCSPHIGHO2_02_38_10]|nr:MAG: hypothetical protein A2W55_01000 [Candidatus Nealsonbacteria bacterium RIFCSPHIGHO2_02_38_10]